MIEDIFSKRRKWPCKDCTKRTVGCHSSCEEYKLAREQRDAINKKKMVENYDTYVTASRSNKTANILKTHRK